MNYVNVKNAANQYSKVGTHSGVEGATPHQLVNMLMIGALDKIAIAKGHMERGDIAQKGAHLSWAIAIIDGLRSGLDMDGGGEVATNLDSLYEYMTQRLAEANVSNNVTLLDEVALLMHKIKSAWGEIPGLMALSPTSQQDDKTKTATNSTVS
ncbi:flagellar export chaperone FliS [Candidatus Pacearchaeota archaeon]|nr:flagellar export chaperone FliS [Candidatus Pacearchaeota archaeon]